ncbi:MAG: hypothetical protein Q8934_10885 [Bacillota bacterium]|nr:hypothetical protein [Bacillota bacterium]
MKMKTLRFNNNTAYSNAVKGYRSLGLLVTYSMIKENEEYIVIIEEKAWEKRYEYIFLGFMCGVLFTSLAVFVVNH